MLDKILIRPHHLYCQQYYPSNFDERGQDFGNFVRSVRRSITSGGQNTQIEVAEGCADMICQKCKFRQGTICVCPDGPEEQVRKWDEIVLSGLGIKYGDKFTAESFHALMDSKSPIQFCKNKCPRRAWCGTGTL